MNNNTQSKGLIIALFFKPFLPFDRMVKFLPLLPFDKITRHKIKKKTIALIE